MSPSNKDYILIEAHHMRPCIFFSFNSRRAKII
nr:MAG TPA_asm: hypothetical protein [Caudoviricetes sp.]